MRDLVDRVYMCIGMNPYWFISESKVSIATVCTSESVKWSKCVENYVAFLAVYLEFIYV
jgi:hypothetical protein